MKAGDGNEDAGGRCTFEGLQTSSLRRDLHTPGDVEDGDVCGREVQCSGGVGVVREGSAVVMFLCLLRDVVRVERRVWQRLGPVRSQSSIDDDA